MKNLAFKLFAFIMILTLTACNLSKPETPGTTASATPTPAAPLPTGFTDLLQSRMDSGEWTKGQGLVTLLKLFAGEIPAGEAGLGDGVLEAEGSGIMQLAADYLENGDDPSAKAEITRLVNLLVPTRAMLDVYSRSEGAASKGPGMAAPRQYDPQECANLWASGFPDTRTPSFLCFSAGERFLDSAYSYRVYYPLAWEGDASKQAYYDATFQAMQDTVPVFRLYGEVKSIYFVFTTLADPDNPTTTLAVTNWEQFRPNEEACPVFMYPISLDLSIDDYKQTVAHEIFHCFETWNLHAQGIGAGYDSAEWWVEGAAEYFSNLVYPSNNYEYRFNDSFSLRSNSEALTSMNYENFTFFQFIANQAGGPSGVLAMLRTMPTTSGVANQITSLAAYPGINDLFELFARQVFDRQLMDTSGAMIPVPGSYAATDTISTTFTGLFIAQPFVLTRFRLIFAGRQQYTTVSSVTGGNGHEAARVSGLPGTWAEIPANVYSGCRETSYILYVLTTQPGQTRDYSLDVTPTGEVPCDECLIGSWEATHDSYMSYMQSILETNGDVTVDSVSGRMYAQFLDTGRSNAGYEDFVLHYTVATSDLSDNPMPIAFSMIFNGQSDGLFEADGANLVFSGEANFTVDLQALVGDTFVDMGEQPINFPVNPIATAAYTCSGNTFTYYPEIPDMTVSPIVFNKTNP